MSMFTRFIAACAAIAVASLAAAQSPPINDNCASAEPMSVGSTSGDTTFATNGTDPCAGGAYRDVWHTFTPQCSGVYRFATCGQTGWDTVVSVHSACPATSANTIGCNDDFCGAQSQVDVNLVAGRVYYIRVAGYSPDSFGPYSIYTAPVDLAETVNDRCTTALPIGTGTTIGDNTCADFDGVTTCNYSPTAALWYSFTPTCSGTFVLDTCQTTSLPTVMTLYSNCGGTELACADDGCPNHQPGIAYQMAGGTTYLIRVAPRSPAVGTIILDIFSLDGSSHPNDSCSSPQVISLGAITGSTNCATTTHTSSCGFNNGFDVWYSFTANCSGSYTFDTCGPRTFDTVISAYASCDGPELACNDDACGLGSSISLSMNAGTTCLIRVAGYNQQRGDFTLNVTPGPGIVPANDTCSDAIPLALGVPATGSNACAAPDGASACDDTPTPRDVWYSFTAPCTGTFAADTIGSDFDTILSIHTGCPGTLDNIIACNDDGPVWPFSRLTWDQTAGTTYYIRVLGWTNSFGNYQLRLHSAVNDDYNNALELLNGTTTFNNTTATTDGIPNGLCFLDGDYDVNGDVWYIYSATCRGTVDISTCGSFFDTKIAIYRGYSPAVPINNPIACNDDACQTGNGSRVQFPAVPGELFTVRVGGFRNRRGCGVINVTCIPTCPWGQDNCFADFNNDGGIDGDDVIEFFSVWDSAGNCADVNLDEGVDGDDVILFFSSWDNAGIGFPGC